jgi:hypothetical protein
LSNGSCFVCELVHGHPVDPELFRDLRWIETVSPKSRHCSSIHGRLAALVNAFDLTLLAVSQHLKVLREKSPALFGY